MSDYLEEHRAYDLFDHLLKDLVRRQPADPLQHMVDCLQAEDPSGPLQVVVVGPPGCGRGDWCARLAEHFGLEHISAGGLLRQAGVDVSPEYAADREVSDLVSRRIEECAASFRGWVLDGFPRTRVETSYLKEQKVMPTHVLVLQASEEGIFKRNRDMANEWTSDSDRDPPCEPDVLERKLRLYACNAPTALESYSSIIYSIPDVLAEDDEVWNLMVKMVRQRARSKAPTRKPRVALVGPRGTLLPQTGARLAARLGAILVTAPEGREGRGPGVQDAVLARLRQPDCAAEGFVLVGFPSTVEQAAQLNQEPKLRPSRVVSLEADVEFCISQASIRYTDPLLGKVWTTTPASENVRKRLVRDPNDDPEVVRQLHAEHSNAIDQILGVFPQDGRCTTIRDSGGLEATLSEAIEFVERPLRVPPRSG